MAKAKKLAQKPTNVFILITTILLLATVGVLTITNLSRVGADCAAVIDSSQILINKSKYKEAYNKLLPYQKKCGGETSKNETANSKIQRLTYHGQLAVSAYVVKEMGLAKSEAQKGLAIMKTLSDSDKRRVPISTLSDMAYVRDELQ